MIPVPPAGGPEDRRPACRRRGSYLVWFDETKAHDAGDVATLLERARDYTVEVTVVHQDGRQRG